MGSSEEIYWNMAKNNRKLDAKMPSCPHFRSEEHTSELQSLTFISYAVFCLKKKKVHSRLDWAEA